MNTSQQPPPISRKMYSTLCLMKAALCCSSWHLVLLNVHHLLAFLFLSQSSLHSRSTFRKKLMLQECKGILKQVASNGEFKNLWTTISCVPLKRLNVWILEGSVWRNFSLYLPTLKISCALHEWLKSWSFDSRVWRGDSQILLNYIFSLYLLTVKSFMCLA